LPRLSRQGAGRALEAGAGQAIRFGKKTATRRYGDQNQVLTVQTKQDWTARERVAIGCLLPHLSIAKEWEFNNLPGRMGKAERAHYKVEMGTGIRPLPILLNYYIARTWKGLPFWMLSHYENR